MSVAIVQDRLSAYNCRSATEEDQALREISQEIILVGLSRTNFFERIACHGLSLSGCRVCPRSR